MEVVAVIDFETMVLSPDQGDRATEIAAVLLKDGKVIDRYQSLMNAGVRIPAFITELTGITDAMIRNAPPVPDVMREVSDFVGDYPLVAHNASFDSRFWDAELNRVRRKRRQEFACSMLVARRLFPQAPNHKLGVLVEYANLPVMGRYHRAWQTPRWPPTFSFIWRKNYVGVINSVMCRMNCCEKSRRCRKTSWTSVWLAIG